jgi:hypothetical protein
MASDFRNFFYRIFAQDANQRRLILKHWHATYPVCRKRHTRLADIFQEFVVDILYEPIQFKLRVNHFCLFAAGKPSLAIQFDWLKEKDRKFIVYNIFAERKQLFKTVKQFENNQFALDDFIHDPTPNVHPYERVVDPIWQREIVRDFVWLVFSRKESYMVLEMIAALQEIMTSHSVGKRDVFVCALHSGLQGRTNIREVLCWNNSTADVHSEEDYQKRQTKVNLPDGLVSSNKDVDD